MPYDQIRVNSIDTVSGSYQLRINFDNNVKWTTTGSFINIDSKACLQGISSITSSRATEELQNALGTLKVELSDHPDLVYSDGVGNIIRECFEAARLNGFQVHAVLGRYSNDPVPVWQEFCFAGTVDPREITISHRRIPTDGTRRTETISCEFTPAKRMDVSLADIDWQESDMVPETRPCFLGIVNEPGYRSFASAYKFLPKKLTELIIHGTVTYTPGSPIDYGDPGALTADIAYGIQPFSKNLEVDRLRDEPGTGPWPFGNWMVKLNTIIDKLFTACNIKWDGVFPDDLNFRFAHFDSGGEIYEDDGDMPLSLVMLNWNYAFGFNPFAIGDANFKSPITWDVEMFCRDALKGIAAQLKSRIDVYGYDADGLPIARFVKFGQTSGTFPTLRIVTDAGGAPASSEDAFITDKDGVRITRRGFDGAVIAPADARSPVDIEVPFAPFAIGYETSPCYDASRLTQNASLDFIDQWKAAFRGSIGDNGGDEAPLNPDGWGGGGYLYRYDSDTDNNQFPVSHTSPAFGEFEEDYRPTEYQGYYPIHAIYDVDRSELTEDERKIRQQNYLISYALYYGRYLRGERGRLSQQFYGCVAPNWSDIATGQIYQFAPITDLVDYVAVEISRDIFSDVISVQFEEVSPSTLPISYRIDGDMKGNGSIGSAGSSGSAASDASTGLVQVPGSTTYNDVTPADNVLLGLRIKNGSFGLPYVDFTIGNGNNNDVDLVDANGVGNPSTRLIGPTSLYAISSIANPIDGRIVELWNDTAQICILGDQTGALGTAANRLDCGGADVILPPDGKAILKYHDGTSRWILQSTFAPSNVIENGHYEVTTTNNTVTDIFGLQTNSNEVLTVVYQVTGLQTATAGTGAIDDVSAEYHTAVYVNHGGTLTKLVDSIDFVSINTLTNFTVTSVVSAAGAGTIIQIKVQAFNGGTVKFVMKIVSITRTGI